MIVRPATPAEAAAALAEAAAAGERVAVRGGGTRGRRGWPGPDPPRTLETTAMRRVVAHEPADLTITVEAGMPVAELVALAAESGQGWPQADVRPGSTVGGVLASAASGRARLRFGPVRDSVLEVVLATGDGRLIKGGGRTVKNVSGYDIPRLVVGSLGTLGAIVQATLKLWPLPAARAWFGAEGDRAELAGLARRVLAGPARPAAVLLAPGRLAVELAGAEADVVAPAGMAPLPAAPPEPAGRGLVEAGVPPPRLPELAGRLEEAGLDYEARLGVGTCLAAVERAADVAAVRAAAVALGGHAVVTAGPDDLREDPWGPPPPGVPQMRRLRAAFDPAAVLDPRPFVERPA